MFRICLLALGMLLSITSHADDEIRCNPSGNQLEMNACASEDFARADKELNSAYQSLLRSGKSDPLFVRKLRSAQQAWLAFRDADLEAAFACAEKDVRICWGSMYPMSFLIRKTELTRERTLHLQRMLEERNGK